MPKLIKIIPVLKANHGKLYGIPQNIERALTNEDLFTANLISPIPINLNLQTSFKDFTMTTD